MICRDKENKCKLTKRGYKTGVIPKSVRFLAGARRGSVGRRVAYRRCRCRRSKAFEGDACGRSECRRNQVGPNLRIEITSCAINPSLNRVEARGAQGCLRSQVISFDLTARSTELLIFVIYM